MNKFIALLTALFFTMNNFAYPTDIKVLATMQSKTNSQDKVWAGTFQIVWNDFSDWIVHDIVRFREGTPDFVKDLNKKTFTVNDISSDCYYKKIGFITKNTKKEIERAIKKKFNETSDIFDSLNLTPDSGKFIIYTMLKKDFEFINAFDKLGEFTFGHNQNAEYFGFSQESDNKLKNGIKVLFYNNKNDFAINLDTKGKDEVLIYKNNSNKPFNIIYSDMIQKAAKYNGGIKLGQADDLRIPNIKFNIQKIFSELANKRVMGTNIMISQAIEIIKFNMNNKGVELKSEAAIIEDASLFPTKETKPKHFYFDDTFVIFLIEKGKDNPYFALRVNDITKFQ